MQFCRRLWDGAETQDQYRNDDHGTSNNERAERACTLSRRMRRYDCSRTCHFVESSAPVRVRGKRWVPVPNGATAAGVGPLQRRRADQRVVMRKTG
jgi:hypothetical protein